MSDELTRLLTETLRGRETDVEPMPDLSAQVLQRGRSVRNRRLALGWGATGVVAAVAFVAAVLVPASQHPSKPSPANTVTPSPTATSLATSPATSGETTEGALMTYALKLPMGPPIAVTPRIEKRGAAVVVVTADHVVTLPARIGSARHLTASAEGLLVSALSDGVVGVPDPDQALYLIRPDGSLSRLHQGPFDGLAVDPTGKRFAIAESAAIGSPMGTPVRITIGWLSGSDKTVSHTERTSDTSLLGWTTRGLLMSDASRSWLWEPGASSETEIPGVTYASVMTTDPGRLLVSVGQPGAGFCLHLYTLSSGQMGPVLTCDIGNGWTVSPDGGRAVAGSAVVDLASGKTGPALMDKLGSYFGPWEDSSHVLTQISGSDPQGHHFDFWVRCDVVTGVCKRAPIKGSNGTWSMMD